MLEVSRNLINLEKYLFNSASSKWDFLHCQMVNREILDERYVTEISTKPSEYVKVIPSVIFSNYSNGPCEEKARKKSLIRIAE